MLSVSRRLAKREDQAARSWKLHASVRPSAHFRRSAVPRPPQRSTHSWARLRRSASPSKRSQSALQRKVDRKSTRLNSSHGYISYAVFCLKKKKNTKKTEQ